MFADRVCADHADQANHAGQLFTTGALSFGRDLTIPGTPGAWFALKADFTVQFSSRRHEIRTRALTSGCNDVGANSTLTAGSATAFWLLIEGLPLSKLALPAIRFRL